MKIDRKLQARSMIEQFAITNDLTMQIRERPKELWRHGRYYAKFAHSEEKGDGVLIGSFGNGDSEDEAILDYARRISGKTLVIEAYSPNRMELRVPIIDE